MKKHSKSEDEIKVDKKRNDNVCDGLTVDIFFELVKSELLATPLDDGVAKSVTPNMMKELYMLSKKHDMTHMVAAALERHNLLGEDEISKKMRSGLYMAVWRDELKGRELQQIYQLFEEEQIAFIPLKGAVIRDLYPEAWMRTSCDIDILVQEDEVERAKEALVSRLNYRAETQCYHDIFLYSPTDVHLELHFHIKEHMDNIDQLLERVWEYAHSVAEGSYQYQMIPEFLMFYLFAHMSYHFTHGGCGVRNFIDIWLIEKELHYERKVTDSYCKTCGIKVFANYARKMSDIWLGDEKHDGITKRMQSHILENGAYGTQTSSITCRNTIASGRGKYLLRRIFMSRRDLCITYPRLKKYPILYLYYAVKRWMKLLDVERARRIVNEVKVQQSITQDGIQDVKELFDGLGLM